MRCLLALFCLAIPSALRGEVDSAGEQFFEREIRPALFKHCYGCHSIRAKVQGGLRLDYRAGLRQGGDSGPAIVPGNASESLLILAIRHDDDVSAMPPSGQLPPRVVEAFERWINMGAPDPRETAPESKPAYESEFDWTQVRNHWAFRSPLINSLPQVTHQDWVRTPLDQVILGRLEAQGIAPSAEADRRHLLRRASFDLTGLPPNLDEVEQVVSDGDWEQAYQDYVGRLLASPRFGQRWGRYWLDVARYADTKGYVFREERSYDNAFRYRNWVIAALNDDMPYDRFLLLQLAADQVADDPDQHVAMGFLTLGRRFLNNQHDIIDDRIDVVMRGTMAMTVGCARCHDHKYDPIPTSDYYALHGVFLNSRSPSKDKTSLLLVDLERIQPAHVLLRGNPRSRGPQVERHFLTALSGPQPAPFEIGSGRLELAREVVRPDNPLTARVFVNRVWLRLFGTGLVTTPSDFGFRSDAPEQPEALDYLALRFVERGWSVKSLVRLIVLSSVYRQSSVERSDASAVDPENRLFWRMNRRRLDFESMRDSMLYVSGRLDDRLGGKSVDIATQHANRRRTIYGHIDRQNLPGLFRVFDFASPDTHAPRRFNTTVPQQALFHLNAPFSMLQAEALASRTREIRAEEERVSELFRLVLSREPEPAELALAIQFLKTTSPPTGLYPWRYGYGHFDEVAGRVVSFQAMPHFTGTHWQGGPMAPDPKLGWVSHHAAGGHPGNDAGHAAIRRWVSPTAGQVSIRGMISHPSDKGDGIRAFVVTPDGVQASWRVSNSSAPTNLESVRVEKGMPIDFVVSCGASPSFDSYGWKVVIKNASQPGSNSELEFSGKRPAPLSVWARLAQALLVSNEMMFLD